MNKVEYEVIGTCARVEISQGADNADQKVKWFLKVHKTYKLLWEAHFQLFFLKVIHFSISSMLFYSLTKFKVSICYSF